MRSFAKVARVDLGFQPRGLVALQLSLPTVRYPDGAAEIRFEQELRLRLEALPGVRAAAITQSAIGIVEMDHAEDMPVALLVELTSDIQRMPDDSDRRVKLIVLTRAGEAVYAKVSAEAKIFRDTTLADVEPAALESATRVLEMLRTRIEGLHD